MKTVNIEKVYTKDEKLLYYLDHPSTDEAMVLNSDEMVDLKAQLVQMFKPTKPDAPKLIIHETDCHGCGCIVYNGQVLPYAYDDGCFGDARATIEELIKIGFIDADRVVVFRGDEIYDHLDIK